MPGCNRMPGPPYLSPLRLPVIFSSLGDPCPTTWQVMKINEHTQNGALSWNGITGKYSPVCPCWYPTNSPPHFIHSCFLSMFRSHFTLVQVLSTHTSPRSSKLRSVSQSVIAHLNRKWRKNRHFPQKLVNRMNSTRIRKQYIRFSNQKFY